MTKEEKSSLIGRLVMEHQRTKETLVCQQTKADMMWRVLDDVVSQLRTASCGQNLPLDMSVLNTEVDVGEAKTVLQEIEHTSERLEDLKSKLRSLGIET